MRHRTSGFLGLATATLVLAAAPRPARAQSRVSADALLGVAHVSRGWYGDRSRIGGRGGSTSASRRSAAPSSSPVHQAAGTAAISLR